MAASSNSGKDARSQQGNAMNELYTKLLSMSWDDKQIWEQIRDEELTAAPCMAGNQYPNAKLKLMIVGRAVNGWQVDFENCSSLESTVASVLGQKNRLDDFANDYIIDDKTGKKYYYAQSPFLRLIKKLVVKAEGTDENWQQKIVWSNLYKIAPRDGGNPSWLMIRKDLQTYIDIIKKEIDFNQPDLILFVTDENFFDPYPGSQKWPSFLSICSESNLETAGLPECIKYVRSYKDDPSKTLIVCKRPEFRSTDAIVESVFSVYSKAALARNHPCKA